MSWDSFLGHVGKISPGNEYGKESRIEEMPVSQRLMITRWLSEIFVQPTDLDIVRQYDTLGDAWDWVNSELSRGETLREQVDDHTGTETGRVALRPVLDRDVMPLYAAAFDPATAGAWRYRGQTISINQFGQQLFEGVQAQFMVDLKSAQAAIGLVSAYDHNPWGLHCKVAFIRCGERFPGDAGAMFEGVMLFISFLFSTFPYRKIFAEIPEYNMGLYSDGFADREGVLRDYLFYKGQFVDMHIVSFSREAWTKVSAASGW
jgi:RimJ/RimL family protein N-acetyltransferase